MATGKRYYWMKLKASFMTSDTIDFFMTQTNGAQYVVLYQMLCLKTINTGGRFERRIGEVLIPYDIPKITRDMKWFSEDTVRVALSLYKQFGLIYEDKNGVLAMSDHENLVGSETDWSEKKRRQRNDNVLPLSGDNVPVLSPPMSTNCPQNVPTDIEIRDKEFRGKDIRERVKEDNDINIHNGGDVDINYSTVEKDKETLHAPADELIAYAANNLRYLSPNNVQELDSFRDSLTDDMIIWAIDQTCENSTSRNYGYCKKILNRMVDMGFKTLGEVKAAEEARQKEKAAQKAPTVIRREGLEDWGELK